MNATTPLVRLVERLERVSRLKIIWEAINVATLAFAIVASYVL